MQHLSDVMSNVNLTLHRRLVPAGNGKGGGIATIYSNIFSISQRSGFKYNYFAVAVLNIMLSSVTSVNDKSLLTFVLGTAYRPPGHQTDHTECAVFLSELVLAANKVLIVGGFNIHADNEINAFIDILNSIGVR